MNNKTIIALSLLISPVFGVSFILSAYFIHFVFILLVAFVGFGIFTIILRVDRVIKIFDFMKEHLYFNGEMSHYSDTTTLILFIVGCACGVVFMIDEFKKLK